MRWFVVMCVFGALIGRLVYLSQTFGGDGAMFAYMGKLTTDGGRFGVDLIDNKLPTVGFITSAFWRVFGTWWPGYVITQTLMAMGGSIMLARAAARAFGEYARIPTFCVAVVLMNMNAAVMGGFQLETIQTFFACVAASCALEALGDDYDWRDAFACGLAAGCAVLIKPTGGAVLGAFLLGILLLDRNPDRKSWLVISRMAIALSCGFAIPVVCAGFYLLASDQLRILPDILRQISGYARSSSFDAFDLYRPLSLLLIFTAAMALRGWTYRRRAVESNATHAVWAFAIAWLTIEFIGVLMQRRMYAYHFLPLAGPAAVVFGALPRRATVGQLVGALSIPFLLNVWGSSYVLDQSREEPANWPRVTAWLVEHTRPGERIWRDQTMDVLLHSDLQPASRIQLTFIFMNDNEAPLRFGGMLIDDLKANSPRYVVLPADVGAHIHEQTTRVMELSRIPLRRQNFTKAWRDIQTYVATNYERVETIGPEAIWQRRDSIVAYLTP